MQLFFFRSVVSLLVSCLISSSVEAAPIANFGSRSLMPQSAEVPVFTTEALAGDVVQFTLKPILRYSPARWIKHEEGIRYEAGKYTPNESGLLSYEETVSVMRRCIEVGIHTDTGGKAFMSATLDVLGSLSDFLIRKKRMPAVDRFDLLERIRENPKNNRQPVIFLLHDHKDSLHPDKNLIEEADMAVQKGANILVSSEWSSAMIQTLRAHYPHIVFIAEIQHRADEEETRQILHQYTDLTREQGRPDGLMLKKYSDWSRHATGALSIPTIHQRNPDLLLLVAGAILSKGEIATKEPDLVQRVGMVSVLDVLARPEGLIPAVGNDGRTLKEFEAKDRLYSEDLEKDIAEPWEESISAAKAERLVRAHRLVLYEKNEVESEKGKVISERWQDSDGRIRLCRVGWIYFIDEEAYSKMSAEEVGSFGSNLILMKAWNIRGEFHESISPYTIATLAAMMAMDLKGKRVIDAGAGLGFLALAGIRLGASSIVLIENDLGLVEKSKELLEMNHLSEKALVIPSSLDQIDSIAAIIERLPTAETVAVSNIGHWGKILGFKALYNVTNRHTLRLVLRLTNVSAVVMGGYLMSVKVLEGGIFDPNRWFKRTYHEGAMARLMRTAIQYGFVVHLKLSYVVRKQPTTTLVWVAHLHPDLPRRSA